MTSSVNGSKYGTQQWGLSDELNSCEPREDGADGIRLMPRPRSFCDPVIMQSTLNVLPPQITVGGVTFAPTYIQVVTGISTPSPVPAAVGDEETPAAIVPGPVAITTTFLVLAAVS